MKQSEKQKLEWNDHYVDNIIDWQMNIHHIAKSKGLELNAVMLYQAFYTQHKQKYGTARFLKGQDYYMAMQDRYEWCACQMNETLEGMISYNNKLKRVEK